MRTIVLVLALIVPLACLSSTQKTAFTGTFTTCAKADTGAVVSAVEAEVSALIAGGGAGLGAGLATLAASAGIDAVDCAIASVEAVLKAGQGSAAPATSEPAWVAAIAQAKAWSTKYRAVHGSANASPTSAPPYLATADGPQ